MVDVWKCFHNRSKIGSLSKTMWPHLQKSQISKHQNSCAFHRKKESRTKICSPCTKKQHASIEIATLSKENGFRVSAKRQHWFFGKPGRWPPKIINFPTHFQTILLDPMASPGSLIHLLISTGEISRKSLVYFLDTNGLQAPKADLVFGEKCVWKLMNPSYGSVLGNHHHQQRL